MRAKVSVIVPVFNVEPYLFECLSSIVSQSYRDLEIICVNAGSMDNSVAIIKEFMMLDERIVLINQPENNGLGGSRNEGLRNATGEYVLFVDSDDWISSSMVERLVSAIEENDVDYAFGAIKGFNDSNQTFCEFEHPFHSIAAKKKFLSGIVNFKQDPELLVDLYPSAWLGMRRLNKIEEHNARFPEWQLAEDHLFHYRYGFKNPKAIYVPEAFYIHRRNRTGQLSAAADARALDIFETIDQVKLVFRDEVSAADARKFSARLTLRLIYEKLGQIDPVSEIGVKFFDKARSDLNYFSREEIYLFADSHITHGHIEAILGASRLSLIHQKLTARNNNPLWISGNREWKDIAIDFPSITDLSGVIFGLNVNVSAATDVSLRLALLCSSEPSSDVQGVFEYRKTFCPGNNLVVILPSDYVVLEGKPSLHSVKKILFGGWLENCTVQMHYMSFEVDTGDVCDLMHVKSADSNVDMSEEFAPSTTAAPISQFDCIEDPITTPVESYSRSKLGNFIRIGLRKLFTPFVIAPGGNLETKAYSESFKEELRAEIALQLFQVKEEIKGLFPIHLKDIMEKLNLLDSNLHSEFAKYYSYQTEVDISYNNRFSGVIREVAKYQSYTSENYLAIKNELDRSFQIIERIMEVAEADDEMNRKTATENRQATHGIEKAVSDFAVLEKWFLQSIERLEKFSESQKHLFPRNDGMHVWHPTWCPSSIPMFFHGNIWIWADLFKEFYFQNSENADREFETLIYGLDEASKKVASWTWEAAIFKIPHSTASKNVGALLRRDYVYSKEQLKAQQELNSSVEELGKGFYLPEKVTAEIPVFHFHSGLRSLSEKLLDYMKGYDALDCGAFVGDSATVFSKCYSFKSIYAIDPNPENIDIMAEVIRLNSVTNVIPIMSGLGEKALNAVHFVGELATSTAVELSEGSKEILQSEGFDAPITTIDTLVELYNIKPRFIKMDIEGSEMGALFGGISTIREFRPVMAISIYHTPEEFLRIKPFLEETLDNYRFVLQDQNPFDPIYEKVLLAYPNL
ncbi:FkbM family methyltransferase [Rhizobiales bacterium TNE-4]|nr:FkbM family methyltransferase [Rhizobiales bacterium TNE-4]MBV1827559.1 FkbM family methyltransferase [Rhizobiales bacterium TNE-4]